MSELKSRFCWRCLFLALIPLVAFAAISWGAFSSAISERERAAVSEGGMVEQLADLDAANADLRQQLAATREALDAARGAALASGAGGVEALAERIAALPARERLSLLDQAGVLAFGPDELIDRISRLPPVGQGRIYDSLPDLDGFEAWFGGLSLEERKAWLARLPGGAQPINLPGPTLNFEDPIRETRLQGPGALGGFACAEEDNPEVLEAAVENLPPPARGRFFMALSRGDALVNWFEAATPGERRDFVNALPRIELVDIRVESVRPRPPVSLAEALQREAALEARLEESERARRAAESHADRVAQSPEAGGASEGEEILRLREQLADAQNERAEMTARTRALRAELLGTQREIQAAARAREAMESALKEERDAFARLRDEHRQSEATVARLETRITELSDERERLGKALNEARAEAPAGELLAQLGPSQVGEPLPGDASPAMLRERIRALEDEIRALAGDYEALKRRAAALEGSVADATEALRRQRDQTQQAREERDAAQRRLRGLDSDQAALADEVERLRRRLQAANAQAPGSTDVAALREELERAEQEVARLEGARKAAAASAEALRRDAAAREQRHQTALEERDRRIAETEAALATAQGEAERLRRALSASRAAAASARRRAAAAERAAQEGRQALEDEISRLRAASGAADAAETNRLRTALDEAEAEIRRLEGALSASRAAAASTRRDAAAAERAARNERQVLEEEIERLRAQGDAENDLARAEKRAEENAEEMARLRTALDQAEAQIRRLEGARQAAAAQAEALRRDAAAAEARVRQELAEYEAEIERLTAAAGEARSEEAARLSDALDKAEADVRRLEGALEAARTHAETQRREALAARQRLARENQRLSQALAEAERGAARAEGGDAEAESRIEALEDQIAGLEAQLARVNGQLEGARRAYGEREAALKSELERMTRERDNAQRSLARLEDQADQAAASLGANGSEAERRVRLSLVAQRDAAQERARRLEAALSAARAGRICSECEDDARAERLAALQDERDAAVALALRLQREVERGDTLLIEGRGAMSADEIAETLHGLEADRERLRREIAMLEDRPAPDERQDGRQDGRQNGQGSLAAALERAERAEGALAQARQRLDALSLAEQERDSERARAEAALERAREGLQRLSAAVAERDEQLDRAERAEAALERAREGLEQLPALRDARDEAVERANRAEAALERARSSLAELESLREARDAAIERAEQAESALAEAQADETNAVRIAALERVRDAAIERAERAEAALEQMRDGAAAGADAGARSEAALRQAQEQLQAALSARDDALADRERLQNELVETRTQRDRARREAAALALRAPDAGARPAEDEKTEDDAKTEEQDPPATAAAARREEADAAAAESARNTALEQEIRQLRAQLAGLESALSRVGRADRAEAEQRGEIVERLRSAVGAGAGENLALSMGPLTTPPLRLDGALVFASGEAQISKDGREKLAALAEQLKRELYVRPDQPWRLAIEGHTDVRPISTAQFPSNWALSAARAAAVAQALTELGVPAHRLLAIGRGEFDPIDPARTEEAFAVNRRIEFDVVVQ